MLVTLRISISDPVRTLILTQSRRGDPRLNVSSFRLNCVCRALPLTEVPTSEVI
jgi:hypothetical protein